MCDKNVLHIQETWKQEFLDSIQTRRPRYIVAHYANGSLAVVEGPSWPPDFPELREIIDRDYEREATFGLWSIFRRKEE